MSNWTGDRSHYHRTLCETQSRNEDNIIRSNADPRHFPNTGLFILLQCVDLFAQPLVQLGVVEGPGGTIGFQLLPDAPFEGIVSGTIITVRWETHPGVSIDGPAATLSDPAMAPFYGSVIYQGSFTNGIHSYATWATIGMGALGATNAWSAGTEVPFFHVPYSNTTGTCITFEVVDDTFQSSGNISWFISLAGLDRTNGYIPTKGAASGFPGVSCQDIAIDLEPGGMASISPEQINTSFSGCTGMILSMDQSVFTCADIGMNSVVLTADANGKITTCNATVMVSPIMVDADEDGFLDCDDACPLDPLKWLSEGICGCGVIDVDTNNNGTCDALEVPPNVKLGVVETLDDQLEFQLLPDGYFDGIVSNAVVTVRWITTPGVSINTSLAQLADPSWIGSVGGLIDAGVATNGIYSYATWVTLGNADLGSADAWSANEEVTFFRVPIENTSGICMTFEVVDDSFQSANNRAWYISLSGEDKTAGFINGKEVAGSDAAGSACDDGDPQTLNDEVSAECICTGTIPFIDLMLTVLLDGPYDDASDLMHDHLRTQSLIPNDHPYSLSPFNHLGTEAILPGVLALTGPDAIVDWVLIELRDRNAPSIVNASRAALLQRDGDVVDLDGTSPLRFFDLSSSLYYVALRHRNHLGTMSALPVQFSAAPLVLDLTSALVENHGADPSLALTAQKTRDDHRMLWSGNVVQNGLLSYLGTGNDQDAILISIGGTIPTTTITSAYSSEDVNMDGRIQYAGNNNDKDPILRNLGDGSPTAIRSEQLP